MKTIEEKAKAYDEALEKAKKLYEKGTITESLNYVFPELAESEDEKIRKELIEHIKANKWADYVLFQKFSPDDVIAWLEKQESVEEIVERCKNSWYNEGKIAGMAEGLSDDEKYQQGWHNAIEKQGEKPQGKTALEAIKEEKVDNAEKVEPKFHEGDWIVYNYPDATCPICKIIQVDKEVIDLVSENGCLFQTTLEDLNVNYHLWTIKDAKDGDVLCGFPEDDYPWIGIFHNLNNNDSFNSYCYLQAGVHGKFCPPSGKNIFGKRNVDEHSSYTVIPATKEQHDKLLKAMADNGYTFDFEKKELKKVEQNSAWSGEDEQRIKKVMHIISCDGRIDNKECKSMLDWLESLKDRYTWKPSNIQMECLYDAINHYHINGYPASKLNELYEQMSKIYKL